MRIVFRVGALVVALAIVQHAFGHGIPIGVSVVGGKLAFSGGESDPSGYASMIFLTDPENGGLMSHTFVPGFGNVALTYLPGFEISGDAINGMHVDDELYLQLVPRPVNNVGPAQQRLLWHWSAATQTVVVDPSGESLDIASGFGQVNVSQSGTPVPAQLKVANPDAEDLGEHVHFLRYLLGDPLADLGVYGFFARLASPNYASSDPLLVILDNDVEDLETLKIGARAINAAAFLPGDFNRDDHADAADYVVWRKTLDGAVDYAAWRENFGDSVSASGPLNSLAAPEPATWMMMTATLLSCWLIFSRGIRRFRGIWP